MFGALRVKIRHPYPGELQNKYPLSSKSLLNSKSWLFNMEKIIFLLKVVIKDLTKGYRNNLSDFKPTVYSYVLGILFLNYDSENKNICSVI